MTPPASCPGPARTCPEGHNDWVDMGVVLGAVGAELGGRWQLERRLAGGWNDGGLARRCMIVDPQVASAGRLASCIGDWRLAGFSRRGQALQAFRELGLGRGHHPGAEARHPGPSARHAT